MVLACAVVVVGGLVVAAAAVGGAGVVAPWRAPVVVEGSRCSCWPMDQRTVDFLAPGLNPWRRVQRRRGSHAGEPAVFPVSIMQHSSTWSSGSLPPLAVGLDEGGGEEALPMVLGEASCDGSIVVDFSPTGGAGRREGRCSSTGDLVWADGERWDRAARLSDLVATAVALAGRAGDVIRSFKKQQQQQQRGPLSSNKNGVRIKAQTDDGVDEPVTLADEAANRIFVNGYAQRFPQLTLFSEERNPPPLPEILSGDLSLPLPFQEIKQDTVFRQRDLLVTIDPLDATKEFTEDLVEYVTTQQCIVAGGTPVAGILHQPFVERSATVGLPHSGQLLGGVQHQQPKGDAASTVTLSRSHTGEGAAMVEAYLPGRTSLPAGGAGYKALLVAGGSAEAYLHVTKSKIWDACAADAVIHAIGGEFTQLNGDPVKYDPTDPVLRHGFLGASSPKSHEWHLGRLKEHPVALAGHAGEMPAEATLTTGSAS